ncbi:MAG: Plasmid encoded RepA protein [Bryobacterales bacterium]|nr:Plasmid encoded RepA protein [Bryobacterales bacterium]
MPFGQDRLVLLWLATQAVRNKSPVVEFGSAAEILNEWRLPTNGVYDRDWLPHSSEFSPARSSSAHEMAAAVLKYGIAAGPTSSIMFGFGSPKTSQRGKRRQNLVTISASFRDGLKSHRIPVDADIVRKLANNPG